MPGARERHFTAQDGLRLFWRDYGDSAWTATPVLCLSGLTRNSSDFADLAGSLAASGRRVLCPDYRGRGRSAYDPDWRNYQPAVYIQDLRHLLALANIRRVVVVGTSLGGILAMALGAVMPTALAGVVLNDVGPEMHRRGLERIVAYVGTDRPQRGWNEAMAEARRIFPSLGLEGEERWMRLARGTFREGSDGLLHYDWDPRIVEPLRRNGPVPDLWPFLRSLRGIPVLAVRGERSDVLSPAVFDGMATELPDLIRATVPGRGHAPILDEPEAAAGLRGFFAKVAEREAALA